MQATHTGNLHKYNQQILEATASPAAITMPMAALATGFLIIPCNNSSAVFAPGHTSQNLFLAVAGADTRLMSLALLVIVFELNVAMLI